MNVLDNKLRRLSEEHGIPISKLKNLASEQAKIELAKNKLIFFTKYTFQGYEVAKHNKLIAEYLDKWVSGEITRLMIFTPPRHGKSELVSRRLPAFIFGKNPDANVISCSYSQERINGMSRSARNIMSSDSYSRIFQNVRLSPHKSSVEEWEVEKLTEDGWEQSGKYICAGIGGGITGEGFDYGIIDDPIKDRKEAESPTVRKAIYDWYTSTFYTRRHPGARILITMTRWHPDDLAGKLLDAMSSNEADKWVVVKLKGIADDDHDLLNREPGEALWPSRYPIEELKKIKVNVGVYDFEALYQQEPKKAGSGKINVDKFEIIEQEYKGTVWVRFWDLAVSSRKSADYTASCKVGLHRESGTVFIKDMIREQWTWPETKSKMLEIAKLENVPIGIEEAGQMKGLIDDLLDDPNFMNFSIEGIRPDADKLTRALPWIARLDIGKVKLIRGNWIDDFIDECMKFTGMGDSHDDQIDAVSGGFALVNKLYDVEPRITWL